MIGCRRDLGLEAQTSSPEYLRPNSQLRTHDRPIYGLEYAFIRCPECLTKDITVLPAVEFVCGGSGVRCRSCGEAVILYPEYPERGS